MNVDILVPVGEKGGVENVINMTVPYLQQQGMQVRVVQLVSSGVVWTAEGIPYYALLEGLDGHTMAEFIEVYAAFIKEHDIPDCILATSWPMMCYVARHVVESVQEKGITVISWLHAPIQRYIDSGYGGYEYLELADAHFAISKSIGMDIEQHIPQTKIELICNPIDLARCVCMNACSMSDMHTGVVRRLYYVGRISEEKRLDLIIQALAASGDVWELYAIGDDDNAYGSRMKKLAKDCGVEQRVHWLGWQTEPWRWVENADAVVLASDFEAYPLTAVEAQANGIMMIATPVGIMEELIVPGENGYLFPCGDWKALSDILYELASGQRPFANGEACRKRAEPFEKERAVEEFYHKLLQTQEQILLAKSGERQEQCQQIGAQKGAGNEQEKGNSYMTTQEVYDTNIQLQTITHEIIYACHVQNYDKVVRLFTEMTGRLLQVLESVFAQLDFYNQDVEVVYPDGVSASLQDMVNAQESQDYVLLADLLELQLLPFVQSLQDKIRQYAPVEVDESVWMRNQSVLEKRNPALYRELMQHHARYEKEMAAGTWKGTHHLEDTNSGAFTLAGLDDKGTYYYHSNVDPVREATEFARYYYGSDSSDYVIWGLGLGYHVQALWNIDRGITLTIVENDLDVIYHCLMTVDMSACLSAERVRLVYDPAFTQMIEILDTATENVILHYPSLRHIPNAKIREQMEMFFIRDSGKRNAAILFDSNSRENFRNYDGYVDELQSQFAGKQVIIVAAGPSLDKNVEQLKDKPANTIILAVETVFRKLLALGIDVDYMIVTDANERIRWHLHGLEEQKIPMLYLATACQYYSSHYAGRKYLICQDGYAPAEELAKEQGWQLYQTGGSVSTTALDVCIRLGCASIVLIGLDLAYTDNKAHADGTAGTGVDGTEHMQQVPAIGGGTVIASRLFQMYNRWIAKRVEASDVTMPVYDATEGGAIVPGLSVTTLQEVISKAFKKE